VLTMVTIETESWLYDGQAPFLTRPLLIGQFSAHADFTITPDDSNLRRITHIDEKFKPFNLSPGFNKHTMKDPKMYSNDTRQLQEWAISERKYFENYYYLFREAEIVCSRGVLTNIARTPFYAKEPWRIVATRQDGIIYLHDCGAIDGRAYVLRDTWDAQLTYWGHHFPRLMTVDKYGRKHVAGEEVDCRETYNGVFRSDLILPDLNRVKLTYSADIIAEDKHGHFVGFKTHPAHNFENDKWLKRSWYWWIQSHLVGMNKIVVGFKSDKGVIQKIVTVERTLLKHHTEKRCDMAVKFLATVLKEVKEQCKDTVQIRYCSKSGKVHFEKATSDTDFLLPEFLNYNS
ncbi:hypothetical protein PENTCL1PPCAC_6069, partial [Pristionchus entomophagus]